MIVHEPQHKMFSSMAVLSTFYTEKALFRGEDKTVTVLRSVDDDTFTVAFLCLAFMIAPRTYKNCFVEAVLLYQFLCVMCVMSANYEELLHKRVVVVMILPQAGLAWETWLAIALPDRLFPCSMLHHVCLPFRLGK